MQSKKQPKSNTSAKRMRTLASVAIVVLALALVGIGPRIEQKQKLDKQVQQMKDALPVVSVVRLEPSPAGDAIALPCNIQAMGETTINARTAGYVKERFVDIGSKVKQGQVLAVLASPETDQMVSQSSADLSKSDASLSQATADLSRLQASISEARSQVSRSQAGVLQAQADVSHLKAKELQAESALTVAQSRVAEAQQRAAGAQADVHRNNVEAAIAKLTYDRWKELEKSQAVAGQEVDEKQADYEAAAARVDSANAAATSASVDVLAAKQLVTSARAEIEAAKADVQSGQQRVQAAMAETQSTEAAVDSSKAAFQAGRSNVSASSAAVSSTRANLGRVSALQAYEQIVAPYSGVITARNVEVGDLINPVATGTGAVDPTSTVTKSGLFGLARTDQLRVQVQVPEDDVAQIHNGESASVEVQEFPGKKFWGVVFNISGALDAVSRTLLVEVRIDNANGPLKPGMFGQVSFAGGSKSTVRIPANALIFDADGTRVAEVDSGGTMHYVTVKPGRDFGDTIEILSGLKGDETLVTDADDSIPDGTKVQIVEHKK